MTKLCCILKNRRGSGFPLTVAATLALVILMCGLSEYFRLQAIAQGVRDALQSAVIATVNDNYRDVYHGAREGYSGGYQPLNGSFEESFGYGDVYGQLDETLGLTYTGQGRVKYTSEGMIELRVWGLDVDITNAPFATGDNSTRRFTADCTIELEVPVSFGGSLLPPMRMTIRTSAGYTPRF